MKRRTKKAIVAAVAVGSILPIAHSCFSDYFNRSQILYGPPDDEFLFRDSGSSTTTASDTPTEEETAETYFDADENTAPVLYGPPEYFENAGDNS